MCVCACVCVQLYFIYDVLLLYNIFFFDRIPVGARFSAPVQTDAGAHTASYAMGTGSFPGVKRPGRGVDHPPHITPRLKKE
jgi:hypothetical protein